MSTQAKQEAFIQGIENGTFQGDAATIYKLIEQNHVLTLPEISVMLDKSLNQFSGRISELLDAGLIKEMKGDKYSLFRVTQNEQEKYECSKMRHNEKIEKLRNKADSLGYFLVKKMW
jgi:DNA-binding transcriptional regulator GbsR (MarR family)